MLVKEGKNRKEQEERLRHDHLSWRSNKVLPVQVLRKFGRFLLVGLDLRLVSVINHINLISGNYQISAFCPVLSHILGDPHLSQVGMFHK